MAWYAKWYDLLHERRPNRVIRSFVLNQGCNRLGNSAEVSLIPVSHEPVHPGATIFIWRLCVTRCPVSRLVHSPGRPSSMITWKISSVLLPGFRPSFLTSPIFQSPTSNITPRLPLHASYNPYKIQCYCTTHTSLIYIEKLLYA